MTKKDKILERLKNIPTDFSFSELESILWKFWFEKVKTNAWSHFKWVNKEKWISYFAPRKNPMKKIYLKQLLEILESYFNI